MPPPSSTTSSQPPAPTTYCEYALLGEDLVLTPVHRPPVIMVIRAGGVVVVVVVAKQAGRSKWNDQSPKENKRKL